LGSKVLSILSALNVGFPGLPVQLSGKEIAEIIKKSRQAPDTIMQFREFVIDICRDDKKLIILVDDMDRLPPSNAVDVMESYEILFGLVPTTEEEFYRPVPEPQGEGQSGEATGKQSISSTAQLEREVERKGDKDEQRRVSVPVLFIFAVDPGILKSGLVAKYGKDALSESMAAAYIAKHFQIVENVPMTEREQTMRLICERIGVYYDDRNIKPICDKIDNSITEAATSNLRYFFQAVGATHDFVERRGLRENAVFTDAQGYQRLAVKDEHREFVLTFFFIYLLYLHTPEIVRWGHTVPPWYYYICRADAPGDVYRVESEKRQQDDDKRGFEGNLDEFLVRNSRIVTPLATAVSILNPPDDEDDEGSKARVKDALAAVLGA
jgi:hypothetical protein